MKINVTVNKTVKSKTEVELPLFRMLSDVYESGDGWETQLTIDEQLRLTEITRHYGILGIKSFEIAVTQLGPPDIGEYLSHRESDEARFDAMFAACDHYLKKAKSELRRRSV